jgi:hypothetical protein
MASQRKNKEIKETRIITSGVQGGQVLGRIAVVGISISLITSSHTQSNSDDGDDFVEGGLSSITSVSPSALNLDTTSFLRSLHASSMEPNTGRKPSVIHAIDSNISM